MGILAPEENSALARLREVIATGQPLAPAHVGFGVAFVEAEPRRSAARMPARMAVDETGAVDLAGLLVLADSVLATAIMTALPEGWAVSTVTMHLQSHALRVEDDDLLAVADVTHVDGQSGASEGVVRTAGGTVVASMSTRCVLHPGEALRPMPGLTSLPAVGSDVRRPWLENIAVVEGTPESGLVTAKALASWGNAASRVQGGALALVAERALHEIWAGRGLDRDATYDLHLTYLAGVVCDGHEISGRAQLLHAGRSLAVARADVLDEGRSKLLAQASRYHKAR